MIASEVRSAGAVLAVFERGTPADGPTILLAHGWPDTHHVWDLVADRLEGGFHVVQFDSRGVGASTAPATRHAFTLDALAADLAAVADAVRPGGPVHLVGHDWGSVQGWEVAQSPALAERFASFTSLSGPCLDHTGALLRDRVRRPSPRGLAPVLDQALRSAYTIPLSTPGVRTGIWRLGFASLFRSWLRRTEGIEADGGYPGAGVADVAIASVPIYRQNIWPRLRRPDPRPVTLPVQLIVNVEDRYVSPRVFEDTARWVADLTRHDLPAGHWSPRTHPDALAASIGDFATTVDRRRQPTRTASFRPTPRAGWVHAHRLRLDRPRRSGPGAPRGARRTRGGPP